LSLVQVTLDATNGINEDDVVNTFHFIGLGSALTVAEALLATNHLVDFYNTDHGGAGGQGVHHMIDTTISRAVGACRMRVYPADEPPLGFPVLSIVWTLGVSNAAGVLPREVSAVGTFHGVLTGDSSDARRRGRVYIGPIDQGSNQQVAGQSRPDSVQMTALRLAMKKLADDPVAPLNWTVYSRVGNSHAVVTGGWTDNAWDTQRRRGIDATAKTTWVAA
jgi:hypothetical protein